MKFLKLFLLFTYVMIHGYCAHAQVPRKLDADRFQRKVGSSAVILLPSSNGTLATVSGTETLENKTLSSPVVNGGVVSGAVINGGTVSGSTISGNYSTGDILVASGSTLVKKPVGSNGQVLTVNPTTGLPDWLASSGGGDSGVNLITNNSFELDVTTGWVTSGVTVARQAFTNGTSQDQYYASMTATVSGAYFETSDITIPDNLRGNDLEFGTDYINTTGAWKAELFVSGTIVASQTLASATTWVPATIMVAGVASNQTTTKVRFTSLTSGTATLGINKVYDGSKKSFTNGAIVGPWQSYTPTFVGFGTVTIAGAKWRQVGSNIEIDIRFTAGTPTGVLASVTLPLNYYAANTSTTNQLVGFAVRSNSSSQHFGVLSIPATNTVTFGGNNGGAAGTAGVVGTSVVGAGEVVTFFASVPVEGLQASGVLINGGNSAYRGVKCYKNGGVVNATSYFASWTSCSGTSSGNFNLSTGEFTADASGDYNYTVCVATNLTTVQPYITLNGTGVDRGQAASNGGTCFSGKIPNVSAGQKLAVYNGSGSSLTVVSNNTDTFISFERASVDGIVGSLSNTVTTDMPGTAMRTGTDTRSMTHTSSYSVTFTNPMPTANYKVFYTYTGSYSTGSGVFWIKVTSKSTTGFTYQVGITSGGTDTGASIDWMAVGF